jgi:hypothetical protein
MAHVQADSFVDVGCVYTDEYAAYKPLEKLTRDGKPLGYTH